MKTVLIHIPWPIYNDVLGGTERYAIDLAKSLKLQGYKCFIVCTNLKYKKIIEGVEIYGVIPQEYKKKIRRYGEANEFFFRHEVLKNRITKLSLKRFSTFVEEQIKQFDADIYHLNSLLYALYLSNMDHRKRIVVAQHENPHELDHYYGRGTFTRLANIIKHSKQVTHSRRLRYVTFTHYYAHLYERWLGFPFSVIPHQIDPVRIAGGRYKKKRPRLLSILVPARLDIHQKGLDTAIEVAHRLRTQKVPFCMYFSGFNKSTYQKEYEKILLMLRCYQLTKCVHIKRFKKMCEVYTLADICLFLSRYESFGIAALESLELGKPTILTRIPSFQEFGALYKNAFFVSRNPVEIADYITELVQSKVLTKRPTIKKFLAWGKRYAQVYRH